ncbi:MAG: sigma-70 family RNA polymerase sigma factor [Actinomycetota bacterium]
MTAGGAVDGETQFQASYERHQPDVLAYFLRRLSRDDAIEATADVFLTIWNRLDDVPPEPETRLWIFGVAHNVLRNRQRTNRRLLRLAAKLMTVPWSEPDPLPETVVVRREEDRKTLEALDRLRPQDREIITLRLWEEMRFAQIGELLGCSRHAAEQRYAAALKRLRSACRRAGHVGVSRAQETLHRQERTREE